MPERLVFELIADGLAANPRSAALNYAPLQVSEGRGDRAFADGEGGTFTIRPRIVVNAAGPWIDRSQCCVSVIVAKMIGGTKGSHLLLKHDELVRSLAGRMIYFEADDGRVCLVYGYFGLALVGSTDIPADDPDNVRLRRRRGRLSHRKPVHAFPGFHFDRSQIVYAYSGIRPLPASDASSRVSSVETIPRRRSSRRARGPFRSFPLSAANGRPFAALPRRSLTICSQVSGGREKFRRRASDRRRPRLSGRGSQRDVWLAETARGNWVGARAACRSPGPLRNDSARDCATYRRFHRREAARPHASDYSRAEIDYLARFEAVERLADIVLRRTALAIAGCAQPRKP